MSPAEHSSEEHWAEVDRYLIDQLVGEDQVLAE